jgi:hypothetical protein
MAQQIINDLNSLQTQFKSLEALPEAEAKNVSIKVLGGANLSVPIINYTKNGVIGSLRVPGGSALIIKMEKPTGKTWEQLLPEDPSGLETFSRVFQKDTGLTICRVFGEDYWKSYLTAVVKRSSEETNAEVCVKMFMAMAVGDMLYWRFTGQLYIEAMESSDTDLFRMICGKKGQIAYTQSALTMGCYNHLFPNMAVSYTSL